MGVYQKEIKRAINWLFSVQNTENFGWSWIRDISPNEQNTAEVVYYILQFHNELTDIQKDFLNESVYNWLIFPAMHASITIDYAWVALALFEYKKCYEQLNPEITKNSVAVAIRVCLDNLQAKQNTDGGWNDHKGDVSTTVRTAFVVYVLSTLQLTNQEDISMRNKGLEWLLGKQQSCGGWSNVPERSLSSEMFQQNSDFTTNMISDQYACSAAVTGYAVMALSVCDRIKYFVEIQKGITYLEQSDVNGNYGIFYEIGIRKDTIFTFRHFGTCWVLLGELVSGQKKVIDPSVIRAVRYLLRLQDCNSGGFFCSEGSDVYTWSTCNVLAVLKVVSDEIFKLSGIDYTDIIVDYISSKNKND